MSSRDDEIEPDKDGWVPAMIVKREHFKSQEMYDKFHVIRVGDQIDVASYWARYGNRRYQVSFIHLENDLFRSRFRTVQDRKYAVTLQSNLHYIEIQERFGKHMTKDQVQEYTTLTYDSKIPTYHTVLKAPKEWKFEASEVDTRKQRSEQARAAKKFMDTLKDVQQCLKGGSSKKKKRKAEDAPPRKKKKLRKKVVIDLTAEED